MQGATCYPLPRASDLPGWEEHIHYVTDYVSPLVRPCLEARRGDFAVTDYAIGSRAQAAGRRDSWAGTANLQGLTQRERALALVELARPRFREELRRAARRLFWP